MTFQVNDNSHRVNMPINSNNSIVDVVFSSILQKYGSHIDVSLYHPQEVIVVLVVHSSGLIDNGGFEYLFSASFDGDSDFKITAQSHLELGLQLGYKSFQEAFSTFPGNVIPFDPTDRLSQYEQADKDFRIKINKRYWKEDEDGGRQKKMEEYINKNADLFSQYIK